MDASDDYAFSNIGHIEGTSSAFYYTSESLKHNRSVPGHVADVFGLGACKTALINMILGPKNAPQHFINGTGYMPTRTAALFYGSDASGKNTLVKAFCAEQNCNFIFVSYAGLDVPKDMPLICRKAMESQPCVVLWDDCTVPFRQNRPSNIIGTYQSAIQVLRDSGCMVWNIFTTVEKPYYLGSDPESLHHAFYSSMKFKIWSGDTGSGEPPAQGDDILTEADRHAVFIKAIGRYYNQTVGNPEPFTQVELAKLAQYSRYCTPGNIINFIDEMHLAHSDRLGISALVGLDTNSAALMPTFQTLETEIENRGREEGAAITHFNPHQINIIPYSPAFEVVSNAWD